MRAGWGLDLAHHGSRREGIPRQNPLGWHALATRNLKLGERHGVLTAGDRQTLRQQAQNLTRFP
jgi:hypothetical protein